MRYGERGGGGQKSEKTKVGNWQSKARNQSWPLALAPKHQGPLERLWYDMNSSLSSQFSNSSLQVPFGMAIVMTPQAGQKGSPHCSSWVISWVPEDTSPKKETRQVSQRSAQDRAQERKLNITKRTLEEGLVGTTQSSSGHVSASIPATARGRGQNLGHRTAMDLHSVTRPGRGQQCDPLG